MRVKCPFSTVFPNELECVYMKESPDGLCAVDIYPGNGDAWCNEMIQNGLETDSPLDTRQLLSLLCSRDNF